MKEIFRKFALGVAMAVGSPWAFATGVITIVVWAVIGPLFGFSDTWQLVINTGTTIVTFLMVFLIQATQNRDAQAIHLKLDELLRGVKGARTAMVELEDCSDEELAQLKEEFKRIRTRARGGKSAAAAGQKAIEAAQARKQAQNGGNSAPNCQSKG